MEENKARIVYDSPPRKSTVNYLKSLEDAEVFEPEYSAPTPISSEEIRDKLEILAKKSFFNKPRTVSETVSQLREHGWATSPLYVSKALAKMAFNKEILKNSQDNRSYYFTKETLLTT